MRGRWRTRTSPPRTPLDPRLLPPDRSPPIRPRAWLAGRIASRLVRGPSTRDHVAAIPLVVFGAPAARPDRGSPLSDLVGVLSLLASPQVHLRQQKGGILRGPI